MPLFAIKSFYVWEVEKVSVKNLQERIVLIKARDASRAIEKAEKEAVSFCRQSYTNINHQHVSIRVLEYFDVHELENEIRTGAEIFSTSTLMTRKLNDKKILKRVVDLDESLSAKQVNKLYDHFRACSHEHHQH